MEKIGRFSVDNQVFKLLNGSSISYLKFWIVNQHWLIELFNDVIN